MAIKTARNKSNTVYTQVNYIDFSKATKTSSKQYADIGDILTYTIALPNNGNIIATDVFFQDEIANGTVFVPNSLSVNGIMKPGADPEVGLNVGNIAPNQVLTVMFKVKVTG